MSGRLSVVVTMMALWSEVASRGQISYSMEKTCSGSRTSTSINIPHTGTASAITIKSHDGGAYSPGTNCRLAFVTTPGYKLLVVFENLQLFQDCTDSLELSNVQNNPGPLCKLVPGVGRAAILSLDHRLNLSWVTGRGRASGKSAFEATITAVQDNSMFCPFHQYKCSNGLCIADHLVCDGNDNCGDKSDEKCQLGFATATLYQAIGIVTLMTALGTAGFIVVARRKRRLSTTMLDTTTTVTDSSRQWRSPVANMTSPAAPKSGEPHPTSATQTVLPATTPPPTLFGAAVAPTSPVVVPPRVAQPFVDQPQLRPFTENPFLPRMFGGVPERPAFRNPFGFPGPFPGIPQSQASDTSQGPPEIMQLEAMLRSLGVTDIEIVEEPISGVPSRTEVTSGSRQFPSATTVNDPFLEMIFQQISGEAQREPPVIIGSPFRQPRPRLLRGGQRPGGRAGRPPRSRPFFGMRSRLPLIIIEDVGQTSSMENLREAFRNRSQQDVTPSPPPTTSHSKTLFPTLLLEERRDPPPTFLRGRRGRGAIGPRRRGALRGRGAGRIAPAPRRSPRRRASQSSQSTHSSSSSTESSARSETEFIRRSRKRGHKRSRRQSKKRRTGRRSSKKTKPDKSSRKRSAPCRSSSSEQNLPQMSRQAETKQKLTEDQKGEERTAKSPQDETAAVPVAKENNAVQNTEQPKPDVTSNDAAPSSAPLATQHVLYHLDHFEPPLIVDPLKSLYMPSVDGEKTLKISLAGDTSSYAAALDKEEEKQAAKAVVSDTTMRDLLECLDKLEAAIGSDCEDFLSVNVQPSIPPGEKVELTEPFSVEPQDQDEC